MAVYLARAMHRYFAYGSNMFVQRIRQPDRAPSAVPVSVASLPGYRLYFHKRSVRDGSGKCNIVQTRLPGDEVHGVLFEIAAGNVGDLDVAEGLKRGYDRREIEVFTSSGWQKAFTYVAQRHFVVQALRPYDWYKDFVVAGADEHVLPGTYRMGLRAVRSNPDPDSARDRAARQILSLA